MWFIISQTGEIGGFWDATWTMAGLNTFTWSDSVFGRWVRRPAGSDQNVDCVAIDDFRVSLNSLETRKAWHIIVEEVTKPNYWRWLNQLHRLSFLGGKVNLINRLTCHRCLWFDMKTFFFFFTFDSVFSRISPQTQRKDAFLCFCPIPLLFFLKITFPLTNTKFN